MPTTKGSSAEAGARRTCENEIVNLPPGALVDGQRRPRALRLAKGVDWYLVDAGRFELVGSGDLSMRDVTAVQADLRESASPSAVFVCVARPREIEEVLGQKNRWGTKRITWATRRGKPIAPGLPAVARGARLAVLPDAGLVWVDGERLFSPGEKVPLPWTDPPISLEIVRPKAVLGALRKAVGPGGPTRAHMEGATGSA